MDYKQLVSTEQGVRKVTKWNRLLQQGHGASFLKLLSFSFLYNNISLYLSLFFLSRPGWMTWGTQ
jgi:hypothetical protein